MEIWKDVKGYEGLYQVNKLGQIKTLEKSRVMPNGGIRVYPEKIMKNRVVSNGYIAVQLCNNGHIKSTPAHRIVAIAFIDNPDNKPQINHIDGDKSNNNVSNLEWVTSQENIIHSFKMKLNKNQKRIEQCSLSGELINTFESTREAERVTGINHTGISYCALGHYKQYRGFIWRCATQC